MQGDVGCIDSVLPPATGVKILVNGQAANPELVKGQAHLWVKGQDMSIVHACAQLHACSKMSRGVVYGCG